MPAKAIVNSMSNGVVAPPPQIDMSRKVTLCAWHPRENTYAIVMHNSMFLYSEKRPPL